MLAKITAWLAVGFVVGLAALAIGHLMVIMWLSVQALHKYLGG